MTSDDLVAFARERLPRYSVPSDWWLRTEDLPTTDVGKVDKAMVRASWPAS